MTQSGIWYAPGALGIWGVNEGMGVNAECFGRSGTRHEIAQQHVPCGVPRWLQRGWLAAVVAAMIVGSAGAANAEQCGFCSIPATRASNGSPIEVRLSIKNDTPADRTYDVDFYAEEEGRCTKITPAPISKRVETGKCGLYATSWTPTGCYGQYALRYVAQDRASGSKVASGASPITIVDSGGRYRSPSTATAAWIEPGALAWNFTILAGNWSTASTRCMPWAWT